MSYLYEVRYGQSIPKKTFHGSGQAMSGFSQVPGDIVSNVAIAAIGTAIVGLLKLYDTMSGTSLKENIWKTIAPYIEETAGPFIDMSPGDNPIKDILADFSSKYNKILEDYSLDTKPILGDDAKLQDLIPKIFELKIIMDLLDTIYDQIELPRGKLFKINIKLSKEIIDKWLKTFDDGKKTRWTPNKIKSYDLMINYLKIKKDMNTNDGQKIIELTNDLLSRTREYNYVFPGMRVDLTFQMKKREENLASLRLNSPPRRPPLYPHNTKPKRPIKI